MEQPFEIEIRLPCITMERTPDFFHTAQQLSDYIKALPLDQLSNDRLVALMVEQVQQAEKGGLCPGVPHGYGIRKN